MYLKYFNMMLHAILKNYMRLLGFMVQSISVIELCMSKSQNIKNLKIYI